MQKNGVQKLTVSLLCGTLLLTALFPYQVHAGFLSTLTALFGNTDVDEVKVTPPRLENSQNMALLEALPTASNTKTKSSADVPIVGGSSLVSEAGPSGTLADLEDKQGGTQVSVYTVQPGDTLSEIAEYFKVTQNTIALANDLVKGQIFVGQKLVILPVSGIQYTVDKGDTIGKIAKKYKIDSQDLLAFNDLASDKQLEVGSVLLIPDAEGDVIDATGHTPVKGTVTKPKARGTNGPVYAGYYMRPIVGGYVSQGIHGYNGVDLAAPLGTSVYAAANGTVLVAKTGGWNAGYGNYIVIEHSNKTHTLYAHLSEVDTEVGDTVTKGDTIGKIGTTGNSTGYHLHFEIRGAYNPFSK